LHIDTNNFKKEFRRMEMEITTPLLKELKMSIRGKTNRNGS
jgi:hypothetical protein